MSSLRRLHQHLWKRVHRPFSTSQPPSPNNQSQAPTLTESELEKLNLLVPRLCDCNQLPTALRLTTTALLLNPPLSSLPLSPLIHSLTSLPHLTHTISLLTHLLHTPSSHPYILPISLSLISSFLHNPNPNPKHALKILRWLQRPNSPSPPHQPIYDVLLPALCSSALLLDALKVLSDMIAAHLVPSSHSQDCVFRALLREARVSEALEFNAALSSLSTQRGDRERVLTLLQRLIAQWTH